MKVLRLFRAHFGAALAGVALSSCGGVSDQSFQSTSQLAAPLAGETALVSVTAPPSGSYINLSNYTAFTLSGFCSTDLGTVHVESSDPNSGGTASANATCLSNAWSVTLDVSFFFDGNTEFVVNYVDPLGMAAPTVTQSYLKDTLAPRNNSIRIGDGVSPALSPNVVLTLASQGAASMYITNTPGCTSGGNLQTFATSANWVLEPVGTSATVYAVFLDEAGNRSPCISATTAVSFSYPTVAITTPLAGSFINLANVSAVTVSGTCSENGRAVTLDGAVSASTICTSQAWSVVVNFSAVADGSAMVRASHTNAAGLSASASTTLLKDTVAPLVAITSPDPATWINIPNQAAFVVSGTCSENGRTVVLSGIINSTAPCSSGVWSVSLNFTGVPDGAVSVAADLSDAAGNPAVQATRSFMKDATAPVGTLTIAGGAASTPSLNVTLNLNSADASQMYLTNTAGCAVGGTLETYAATRPWVLVPNGAVATVYGYFRDAAGNIGPCLSDSINISVVPLAISPASVTLPSNVAQTVTFTASGGSGGYQFSVLSGPGAIGASSGVFTVASGAQGTTIVRVTDSVNASANATITFLVGNTEVNQLVFDGSVKAIGFDVDQNAFYGGSFTRVAGARTPAAIGLDALGGVNAGFNLGLGFDGPVHAVLALPDGTWIVGGSFSSYRSAPARSIAHLNAQGELDSTFSPASGGGFDGAVHALAVEGNSIYVGGEFRKYRGVSSPGIVKLNLAGLLDTVFTPSSGVESECANGTVYAIAVSAGSVYIGGSFTSYRRQPAYRIAKLDGVTGALNPHFSPSSHGNGFDGVVRALAVNSSHLYVGGQFNRYRNSVARSLAKLSLAGQLDTSFTTASGLCDDNGEAPIVRSIVLGASGIYIGGDFESYRGASARHLAKLGYDGRLDGAFSTVAGENGADRQVYGLALSAGKVYAVGVFSKYRGRLVNGIARISEDTGVLDTAFGVQAPGFSHEGEVPVVEAIALNSESSQLLVGGDLEGSLYGGVVTGRLAKVKPNGDVDLNFLAAASVDAPVNAIAISGRTLYFGGDFRRVGGQRAERIAKASSAGVLDTGFNPSSGANGVDQSVFAIAIAPDSIYIGGAFRSYRGVSASRLARVSLAGVLRSDFDCREGMDGTVRALAVTSDGSKLFAGGEFTHFRGLQANRIAKINTGNLALDLVFNPQSSRGHHRALASRNGDHDSEDEDDDNDNDHDSGGHSSNGGNGTDAPVLALLLDSSNTRLYVGGKFRKYRGESSAQLVRLALDGNLDRAFSFARTNSERECRDDLIDALAIDASGSRIFAGGRIASVNGSLVRHVVELSANGQVDTTFSPTVGASGVLGYAGGEIPVQALATNGNLLHIGGAFRAYRDQPVQNLAIVDFQGALSD